MRRALIPTVLLVLLSVVLGATVLREPLASAKTLAQSVVVSNMPDQPVPVHEQGTANVNVANTSLKTSSADTTDLVFHGYPNGTDYTTPVLDVSRYSQVRINMDNGYSGPAPVRIFSLNAAGTSASTLEELTIAGFGFVSRTYDVPGQKIYVSAYGGVTNVHIQVFARP